MAWTTGSTILPEDCVRWDGKANANWATPTTGGLMTAADKTKLDAIEAGAQKNPAVATASVNGLMAAGDKAKLNGIATGATANATDAQLRDRSTHTGVQPADSITQTASARFVTDTEKSTWNGKANNTVATQSNNGLISASDKTKLDSMETGAQKNPNNATPTSGGLMSSTDKSKLDGISVGADKTPGVATTSSNGLMSSTDKTKLDGVATGATRVVTTPDITSTSETEILAAASIKYYMSSPTESTVAGVSAITDIPYSTANTKGLVKGVVTMATHESFIQALKNRAYGEYIINPARNSTLQNFMEDMLVDVAVGGTAKPAFPPIFIDSIFIHPTGTTSVYGVKIRCQAGYELNLQYRTNVSGVINMVRIVGKSTIYNTFASFVAENFFADLKAPSVGVAEFGFANNMYLELLDFIQNYKYEMFIGSSSGQWRQRRTKITDNSTQYRIYDTTTKTWSAWV